jgi:hypothetical protein
VGDMRAHQRLLAGILGVVMFLARGVSQCWCQKLALGAELRSGDVSYWLGKQNGALLDLKGGATPVGFLSLFKLRLAANLSSSIPTPADRSATLFGSRGRSRCARWHQGPVRDSMVASPPR